MYIFRVASESVHQGIVFSGCVDEFFLKIYVLVCGDLHFQAVFQKKDSLLILQEFIDTGKYHHIHTEKNHRRIHTTNFPFLARLLMVKNRRIHYELRDNQTEH